MGTLLELVQNPITSIYMSMSKLRQASKIPILETKYSFQVQIYKTENTRYQYVFRTFLQASMIYS